MQPVFEAARKSPKRIVYSDGTDERVLRAAQTLVDEGIAVPVLIGRHAVIERKVREMGLRLELGGTVRVLDPGQDGPAADKAVFAPLLADYQRLAGRRGVPPEDAAHWLVTRRTVAAAMLLHAGLADAAICGGSGDWWRQLRQILPIIPRRPNVARNYAMSCLILPAASLFICDTHMVVDPTAEQITEMTLLAAEAVGQFGIAPKVALLSHSNFGASDSDSARKMRHALAMIRARAPALEVDGEMHGDSALVEAIRDRAVPDGRLRGTANLLIMPSIDAANISFNLLRAASDGLSVGPILLGMSKPIHVVVPSVTARGIVNLSALAALGAQDLGAQVLGAQHVAARVASGSASG
jgi:malate dehydrogenase (oxaloacetate-decarboxylating)(NADP+)